jgi:hypothetical protein
MFKANAAACRFAAKQNDIAAGGFSKIAVECLRAYHLARAARVKAEIESGRLLPISEYERLKSIASWFVRFITDSLGPKLASQLAPHESARFLRAYEEIVSIEVNAQQEVLALTAAA